MVDDDFIGEVIGGSSFDDQIAKFMRTPQFSALLTSVTGTGSTSASSAGAASGGFPVGSVTAFSGEALPTGYLWCDGSPFEAVVYPELREVLGVKYVLASDSPGIYRVPDLRSRVPVGAGQGASLSERVLAASGGQENAVVVAHDHGAVTGGTGGSTEPAGNHSHTVNNHDHFINRVFGSAGTLTGLLYAERNQSDANVIRTAISGPGTNETGSHSHTVSNHSHSIPSAGESGTGKNMPPFVVLNYIIKAR
jgi:microcystin-dependent protein